MCVLMCYLTSIYISERTVLRADFRLQTWNFSYVQMYIMRRTKRAQRWVSVSHVTFIFYGHTTVLSVWCHRCEDVAISFLLTEESLCDDHRSPNFGCYHQSLGEKPDFGISRVQYPGNVLVVPPIPYFFHFCSCTVDRFTEQLHSWFMIRMDTEKFMHASRFRELRRGILWGALTVT